MDSMRSCAVFDLPDSAAGTLPGLANAENTINAVSSLQCVRHCSSKVIVKEGKASMMCNGTAKRAPMVKGIGRKRGATPL